jgi:gas vesicle protein
MSGKDPRWGAFWQNLIWFFATMIALVVIFNFTKLSMVLLVLWLVGLTWGGYLAYRGSNLLFNADTSEASQIRSTQALAEAYDYQAKIEMALDESPDLNSVRTAELTAHIERLTEAITNLSERVIELRGNRTIRRDMKAVPEAIADLKQRIESEDDPDITRQLERTLGNRQKQLEALDVLDNTIKRAEIQIESTLSQLGTIYSQLLTGQSTSDVAVYHRLTDDVDEEVRLLEDHLDALQEVKLDSI